jgi:hypothetical protein
MSINNDFNKQQTISEFLTRALNIIKIQRGTYYLRGNQNVT